ncbi:hypothetical protein KSD_00750 [Ktedonobacter sp. SOSP1-85]|uniref:hypothetical protein n=1 Tax=Ktedonobacter sp. SOSP1-85 TaxID=2778367 RepID=UPI00191629B3|nr:hypothetical protein [Ktedonobacter sp. SOSP1-85]GHO72304.1 hypothetical protein KSD_00750 [Ktedonobacter sp. SOSP1-85]
MREEYAEQLQLLGIMDGTRETERRLHHRFDHLRRFSEWFRPRPEFLAFLEEYARPLPFPTSERRPLPAHIYEKQQCVHRLYDAHPDGLTDIELAGLLQVSGMTANRYRHQLHAVKVHPGRYCLVPRPEEITEALDVLKVAISTSLIHPQTLLHTLSPANA